MLSQEDIEAVLMVRYNLCPMDARASALLLLRRYEFDDEEDLNKALTELEKFSERRRRSNG